MTEHRIKVLCVDDNEALLEALQMKLAAEPDVSPIGCLYTADALVETAGRLRPDIVLLDLDMPGQDPIAAIADLSQVHPDVRVVILSGYVREEYIKRALDAGALGYLAKGEEPEVIVGALRRVAAGNFAFGNEVAQHLRRSWNS